MVTRPACTQVMHQAAKDWVNTITNRPTRRHRDQSVAKRDTPRVLKVRCGAVRQPTQMAEWPRTYSRGMPCIFCGRSAVTNEHVFPRWLDRYLPPGRQQQLEQARYGRSGFDITRPSVGLDFRVRKVCGPCNNGWMSLLEEDSMEALHPLISGLDLQLVNLRRQRQIALWATKTAMIADQTQDEPLLPGAQLARMRTHRAIPGTTRVWVGASEELQPLVTSTTVRIELENLDDPEAPWPLGFYAAMKIGHLCLYVYFPGADVVVQHPPGYHTALARIWPRRRSGLPWPPPARPRNSESFERLADDLWRSLRLFVPERARELNLRES